MCESFSVFFAQKTGLDGHVEQPFFHLVRHFLHVAEALGVFFRSHDARGGVLFLRMRNLPDVGQGKLVMVSVLQFAGYLVSVRQLAPQRGVIGYAGHQDKALGVDVSGIGLLKYGLRGIVADGGEKQFLAVLELEVAAPLLPVPAAHFRRAFCDDYNLGTPDLRGKVPQAPPGHEFVLEYGTVEVYQDYVKGCIEPPVLEGIVQDYYLSAVSYVEFYSDLNMDELKAAFELLYRFTSLKGRIGDYYYHYRDVHGERLKEEQEKYKAILDSLDSLETFEF